MVRGDLIHTKVKPLPSAPGCLLVRHELQIPGTRINLLKQGANEHRRIVGHLAELALLMASSGIK